MDQHAALRAYLAKALDWQEAHAGFEKVVEAWPPKLRGTRLEGLPYSAWQLIEHMRLTQHDILEFCRNPNYVEPHWPDDYWPPTGAPPSSTAWNKSVAAFHLDRDALKHLANDPGVDTLCEDSAWIGPDLLARAASGRRSQRLPSRRARDRATPARRMEIIDAVRTTIICRCD